MSSGLTHTDPFPPFMITFNDLPLELLPGIVQNVVKPMNLASFCLVNKIFCEFTRPFLYHTIAVFPWHHKEKVMQHNRKPSCRAYLTDLVNKDRQTLSYSVVFSRTSQARSEVR